MPEKFPANMFVCAAPSRGASLSASARTLRRGLAGVGLSIAGWWACMPSTAPTGPETRRSVPEPPVEAELRAAPPSTPIPAPSTAPGGTPAPASSAAPGGSTTASPDAASPAVVAQPTPVAPGSSVGMAPVAANAPPAPPPLLAPLECVDPPDPELDKESDWSKGLGRRLEAELTKLRECTSELLPEDEGQVTLRLVYRKDGSPVSQHIVTSTSNACAATECLKTALSTVHSGELLIDRASIDVTLSLARGETPKRISDPVDPLPPEEAPAGSGGCVDEDVARLSRAKVREIVSGTYDQLQLCYAKALVNDHSLAGKVTFEFVIAQNGGVEDAWARDSSLQDCAAIGCMLAQFRGLKFPEPVGRAVRVIYPISYAVEQSPVTLR